MPPNLLVFMVDQWRYDTAGHQGNPIVRTPNLDRLAAEGVRLSRAFTTVPLCTPTRASLWSGLWPSHHGVLLNTHWRSPAPAPQNARLPDGTPTLGTVLRDAGYATAYFGKWHVGPESDLPRCGFEHSPPPGAFQRHLRERGVRREVRDAITRDYIVKDYVFAGTTNLDGDDFLEIWLCSQAEAWLRRQRAATPQDPFACVISLPGPHPGYVVPERYARLYDPHDMPLWPNTHDDLATKPSPHRLYRDAITHSGSVSDAEWRTCIARYYAFCTLIDEQLGRMLALLEDLGVGEDTLVLFVTDHGDLIGAHGLWDKGPSLYEEQIHIPCVARLPGGLPAGQTCASFAMLHDLMPTLVEGLGQSLSRPVDGRSLWGQLRGDPPPVDWPDDAYVQYHGEGISLYSIRALRTERHKYVYYPFDRDELYDLDADPWELRNLAEEPEAQPVLEEMRARLVRRMRAADDVLHEWNAGLTPLPERLAPS
ncbi:MAG TPA: sulfatase-like hydrolase/transferase [Chloroflexota bacterium]|nr:sulfatase-like hydrolase/transferase [Chloroflexota bacterium]